MAVSLQIGFLEPCPRELCLRWVPSQTRSLLQACRGRWFQFHAEKVSVPPPSQGFSSFLLFSFPSFIPSFFSILPFLSSFLAFLPSFPLPSLSFHPSLPFSLSFPSLPTCLGSLKWGNANPGVAMHSPLLWGGTEKCSPCFLAAPFCLSLCPVVKTLVLNKIIACEVSEFANIGNCSCRAHSKDRTQPRGNKRYRIT